MTEGWLQGKEEEERRNWERQVSFSRRVLDGQNDENEKLYGKLVRN